MDSALPRLVGVAPLGGTRRYAPRGTRSARRTRALTRPRRPVAAHCEPRSGESYERSESYFCIAARNSLFVLVLPIFDSSSSIASTGDSGVSTRRST